MTSHDHSPSTDHLRGATRRALLLALVINTVFFLVVLVGAFLANSVTLLAEAAHMLTDSISLIVALAAARVAAWAPDARRTYGYHRAEVLGGLVNAVLLLVVVAYVLIEALGRFRNPPEVDASMVILIGSVGIVANLAAAWVLVGHRHSLNVEGAFLHLVADAAGSVAAVALGIALLVSELYILDPVFAVLIAAVVLNSVKDLLRDSVNILLQGTPRDVDLKDLVAALCAIEGVRDVHDVHVWALDSNRTALSVHLVVEEHATTDTVLAASQAAAGDHGVDHATIQIESPEFTETRALECYPGHDHTPQE